MFHRLKTPLMLTLLLALPALGRTFRPSGDFRGYYVVNRWGDKLLVQGTTTYFLSDDAAKILAPHQGKPLVVTTSKMVQESDFGDGMMMSVDKVVELDTPPGVSIAVQTQKAKVAPGEGIVVQLTIENHGKKPITFDPRDAGFVFSSNKADQPPGWHDVDQRAYWYSGTGMTINKVYHICVYHASEQRFTAKEILAAGKEASLQPGQPPDRPRISLAPGGSVTVSMTLGKELLPGEYEIFAEAYIDEAQLPSQRATFDVVAPK